MPNTYIDCDHIWVKISPKLWRCEICGETKADKPCEEENETNII